MAAVCDTVTRRLLRLAKLLLVALLLGSGLARAEVRFDAVSYTHLTLPTILLV